MVTLRGHGNRQSDDLPGIAEVNLEKTTNEILSRRELLLSKEALLERHAAHLTRHFMRTGKDREEEKLQKQAELSRRDYERYRERAKHDADTQALLKQMVREQRSQIFELIQDKEKQRQDEQRQAREERAEQEKWLQARALYEQMDQERRLKGKDEKLEQLVEKLQAKSQRQEEAFQQAELERKEQMRARLEKELKKAQEAEKRRREQAVEARAKAAAIKNDKVEQADQRRQQIAEEAAKSVQEAALRKEKKVRELKHKADQELEERQRQLIQKVTADRQRQGDAAQRQHGPSAQHGELSRHGSGRAEQQEEMKPEEAKASAGPSIYYYCTPRVGRELVDANVRVQKEYVRRCHDLDKDKDDMLTNKKFKSIAEAARTIGDRFEGGYTRKMRSLHKMYIDPKHSKSQSPTTSPRAGASSMSSANTQPALRPLASTSTQRWQKCGLCERELPVESLEGSALRRNVEKFRQQISGANTVGQVIEERRAVVPETPKSSTLVEQLSASSGSKSERASERIYDHDVRLCTSCWHKMRIAST